MMRRGKLIMITLGVLITGLVAALPYQRGPRSTSSEELAADADSALSLRKRGDPREGELMTLSLSPAEELASSTEASPAAEFLQSVQQREPVLELPRIRRDQALRSGASVPELAPSFRPFTETIRLLRDVEVDQQAKAQTAPPLDLTPPPAAFVAEPAVEQPPRHHRIVDGDTLQSIAERYYDDPTHGGFLFEANRSVLSQPDVLPLGTELKIPPLPLADPPPGAVLGIPQGLAPVGGGGPVAMSPPLVPVSD